MSDLEGNGNLVITGIPRSGTSYACALLNNMRNTVIVNEPEEVFTILHNSSGETLQSWYDRMRSDVAGGRPIQNKIVNGRFIEDTNKGDVRSFYTPEIDNEDFVFGTKNTLVYLASLHKLHTHLPGSSVVAIVRHPFDCIASWKQVRFPHIRNAAPRFLKDYMDAEDGSEVEGICDHPELEVRYAMLWRFLATRIIKYRDRVDLCRYEDFVIRPEQWLEDVFDNLGRPAVMRQPIESSAPRKHANSLSGRELDCIREYCGDVAGELDYSLQGTP